MEASVELKVENHHSEFELQNIINLFRPYMDKNKHYTILSKVEVDRVGTVLLDGDQVVFEAFSDIDGETRKDLKKSLYRVLSQLTGREMPWGVLTGIRPTKVVHNYIKNGYNEDFIKRKLMEDYCISQEKTKLMLEIANEEGKILSKNKKDEISLYIGIPFCPTRCLYCSFTSYSLKEKGEQVDAYLEALIKEIRSVAEATKNKYIRSLYIGGGTPTSLNDRQLERLLEEIDQCFEVGEIEEYTIEAGRPDTLNREKLRLMKQFKVGRISINPQTMSQNTLELVGRSHSAQEIISKFNMAREEGHDNINMDLIVGLPGETAADVKNTMEELAKLMPDSITAHTMAIKRASRLKEEIKEYDLTKVDEIQAMLEITAKEAEKMGMSPYYMYRQKDILGNFENVGYAIRGKESIYNIQMIAEQETIIAMGAGAVTKVISDDGTKINRIPNVKNLEQYISRVDEMIERKVEAFER